MGKANKKLKSQSAAAKPIATPSWPMVKLGDVCEVRRGSSITRKQVVAGDVPVVAGGQKPSCYHNTPNRVAPVITVSASGAYAGFVNFFNHPIFASDCSTIQPMGLNNLSLPSMSAATSERAHQGSADLNLKNKKRSQARGAGDVVPVDKQCDVYYIYYILKSMQNDLYNFQRGAAQPHVYPKDLIGIEFMLPPLSIQKQIVKKIELCFGAIDAMEAAAERVDELLHNTHKAFMQQALSGQLTGCNKKQASPWPIVKLGDVCEVRRGSSITRKQVVAGDVPVVAGGQKPSCYHNTPNRVAPVITVSASGAYAGFVNFFNHPIFASDCSTIQPMGLNNLSLPSMSAATSERAHQGSADLNLKNKKRSQARGAGDVVPVDKQCDVYYIYYILKSMQNDLYNFQRGAAQPHVYPKDLIGIEFMLPPLSIQKQIVEKIEDFNKKMLTLKEGQATLKKTLQKMRAAVLQQALAGRL